MQPVLAIALLSIRNAIRSKLVLILLFLLIVIIILLPLSIKGDGTISGFIQVLLSYTLGISTFILALTSLWAGSASVSTEINARTIQMIACKPVNTAQIWMGKWLGLCALNAVFLSICVVVTYGMLHWHLNRADQNANEQARILLTARQERSPILPDLQQNARNELNRRLNESPSPEGVSREQTLKSIHQQLLAEFYTVRPGGRKRWEFNSFPIHSDRQTVTLQYRFSSSVIGQNIVRGRWLIGTSEQPDLFDIAKESVPRALNEIHFVMDHRWDGKSLILTYVDLDQAGATMLFDFDKGLLLLTPEGSFAGNYTRAALILFGQLAFFTALGITAGCLFSLPVAAFTSIFLLIMIHMGSYIQGIAMTEITWPWQATLESEATTWFTIVVTLIFRGMAFVMSPLVHESALNSVSTGRIVDIWWTVRGFLLQGVAYSVFFGWCASILLKRRELALPQT
ncbi:MAG TPA: hypothetical protein PJ991_08650 [Kiritimatiellia bacterium]|nr:hypothetical protein [Kiritimatiellia bacterium]